VGLKNQKKKRRETLISKVVWADWRTW